MKRPAYLIVAASLLPLVLSVLVSFTPSQYLELPREQWTLHWFHEFRANRVWTQALANSLLVGVAAALTSVAAGLATALALARGAYRWKGFWESALLLPLVLPAVALGVGMMEFVRHTPLWGNPLALVVAHAVLATPVAYLVLRASIEKLDPNLEAAARGLGAGPWRVFRHVTLPLIAPGVLAAGLFSLVISLNEITLALFLSTRDTETLPRVIWPNLRFAITPLAAAASAVLLALTLPAVVLAGWWLRPRAGLR
jgi:ABC-type spermidine/putrescine transport system permease subunit II